MPSEILGAIKYVTSIYSLFFNIFIFNRFELVEPIGLDENQLRDIPYENVK